MSNWWAIQLYYPPDVLGMLESLCTECCNSNCHFRFMNPREDGFWSFGFVGDVRAGEFRNDVFYGRGTYSFVHSKTGCILGHKAEWIFCTRVGKLPQFFSEPWWKCTYCQTAVFPTCADTQDITRHNIYQTQLCREKTWQSSLPVQQSSRTLLLNNTMHNIQRTNLWGENWWLAPFPPKTTTATTCLMKPSAQQGQHLQSMRDRVKTLMAMFLWLVRRLNVTTFMSPSWMQQANPHTRRGGRCFHSRDVILKGSLRALLPHSWRL